MPGVSMTERVFWVMAHGNMEIKQIYHKWVVENRLEENFNTYNMTDLSLPASQFCGTFIFPWSEILYVYYIFPLKTRCAVSFILSFFLFIFFFECHFSFFIWNHHSGLLGKPFVQCCSDGDFWLEDHKHICRMWLEQSMHLGESLIAA